VPHPHEPGIVAAATERAAVSLWDIGQAGKPQQIAVLATAGARRRISAAMWAPDGTCFACADSEGAVTLYAPGAARLVAAIDMFMPRELGLTGDEIVDREGRALLPQPRRVALAELRLGIADKRLLTMSETPPIEEQAGGIKVPECCFWTERFAHSCVPQVSEVVVYLRTGHAAYIGTKRPAIVPPFVDHPELPPVARAQVRSVGLCPPDLIIELSFGGFTVALAYPVPECPPFLVPEAHFARSLEFARKLAVDDIVDVFFADGATRGRVIAPPVLEPDPYDSIEVEFTDDETSGQLQPWEILFPEKPGQDECAMMRMCASLSDMFAKMAQEAEEQIQFCRSERALAICARRAEAPMDLTLIAERLRKNYYATPQSLLADVRQLGSVATVLGTGIEAARSVVATVTPMIRSAAEKEGLTIAGLSDNE
jgi:hypothetical protein